MTTNFEQHYFSNLRECKEYLQPEPEILEDLDKDHTADDFLSAYANKHPELIYWNIYSPGTDEGITIIIFTESIPEIIIQVEGGLVQSVYSNSPVIVRLYDWDNIQTEDADREEPGFIEQQRQELKDDLQDKTEIPF